MEIILCFCCRMTGFSTQLCRCELTEVQKVLTCLSQPQENVERALGELSNILKSCALNDIEGNTIRNLCFSNGIISAVLGILQCSSQLSMLVMASRCIALLTHGNEEARIRLGELGVITIFIFLLHDHLKKRKLDGSTDGRTPSLWCKEWVPLYEQVLICLRKLTFHSITNQQELAEIGGIKMIVALATDQGLTSNFGKFTPAAKKCVESLTLRKKFVARVSAVPENEKMDVLGAFPALIAETGPLLHYPMFYIDLVTEDGVMVTSSLLDEGVVWPTSDDNLASSNTNGSSSNTNGSSSNTNGSPFQWTYVVVECVEDGNSLWCQFCTKKENQALLEMKNTLSCLVCSNDRILVALFCMAMQITYGVKT